MHEVHLRPAVREDAAGLAALTAVMGYEVSTASAADRLHSLPADHAVFVAHDVDDVVGFVHVYVDHTLLLERRAQLGGLAVLDGWHGRGVAAALLRRAEGWAAEAGCSTLFVRSGEAREQAHRFYVRAGYRPHKRQQVFVKDVGAARPTS
ncbi:GNAT family N-acetyltransferase [Egicoccus sp. AB-alg2]|uniref:GNAT family N-acetyltransferase n=1 Tax=Egicoccus sp. AB-alg2 TaxID=3242693 RepID=UPI00359E0D0F